MPVSIFEVARHLNLSITTVSRALNNYKDVSSETRQRVQQAVVELGYTPNQAARQLRHKYADSIGYILPASAPRFSDPFFAEFIAGLGEEASQHGLDLLVSAAPHGRPGEQVAYTRWINSHKVDGMVLNRIQLHDWRVRFLAEANFPFVTQERSLDPFDYPSVEVDGRRWFKVLIDHLASIGHQRIAYIGASDELKIQVDRFAGYQDGLQANGLVMEKELVEAGNLTSTGGYQAAERLLSLPKPPSAIACVDDLTAMGVLHAAHDRGLAVGRDLAVTGFDGIERFVHTQPPLTTVNQPVYEIARSLVLMLVRLITGKPLDQERVQMEPVLEIRQSTAVD